MSDALKRYLAEVAGTFVLVAIGPGAAMVAASTHAFGQLGVSLAFGVVIMAVITDVGVGPRVAPYAIGATVFLGALVTGPMTGGSFNPARTLGPAVVGHVWSAHWLYWAAPICGMIAAMRLYEALRGAVVVRLARRSRLGAEGQA
ncbi:MAG TPA: aquaporin [Gemmatimonadaceae bacterium]